ncbi:MAG: class I SAM-dependent methyltransferase [Candidatus Cloacimonetes bacterium]|nr:class I SAM-dependent methyltransferase [Candidatus Cloacimonadota bacterium]
MAIPILHFWEKYFDNPDEGLGSTYERFIINDILFKIVKHYRIKNAIETPSFGFTGLSGINSMGLATKKVDMTITDSDLKRLEMIKNIWSETDLNAKFDFIQDYSKLPYNDNCFDMAWNFSALWFVHDLEKFLTELSRISSKIILLIVPNRTGIGYIHQKYKGKKDLMISFKEENIIPKNFIVPLEKMNWKLMHDSLIDCPLWPDIGMSKEDFLSNIFYPFFKKENKYSNHHSQLSIINFYKGNDVAIKNKVLKYNFFENHAPEVFKKIWSHHHYYLFLKKKS